MFGAVRTAFSLTKMFRIPVTPCFSIATALTSEVNSNMLVKLFCTKFTTFSF